MDTRQFEKMQKQAVRGKYRALFWVLASREGGVWHADFQTIEEIVDYGLPSSARLNRDWWSNSANGHTHARAWIAAGWEVSDVHLQSESVTFRRDRVVAIPDWLIDAALSKPYGTERADHEVFFDKMIENPDEFRKLRENAARGKYKRLFLELLSYTRGEASRRTFGDIEAILGFDLPEPARKHEEWWANHEGKSQALVWLGAGWIVGYASIETEAVMFIRKHRFHLDSSLFGNAVSLPTYKNKPLSGDWGFDREEIYGDRL